jgi:hypothetical protein
MLPEADLTVDMVRFHHPITYSNTIHMIAVQRYMILYSSLGLEVTSNPF